MREDVFEGNPFRPADIGGEGDIGVEGHVNSADNKADRESDAGRDGGEDEVVGGLAGEGAGGDEDQGAGVCGRGGWEDEIIEPGRKKGGGCVGAGGVVAFEGAAEANVCGQVGARELQRRDAQLEVNVAEQNPVVKVIWRREGFGAVVRFQQTSLTRIDRGEHCDSVLIQQQVLFDPLTRQSHAHERRVFAQHAEGEVSESDQRDVSN